MAGVGAAGFTPLTIALVSVSCLAGLGGLVFGIWAIVLMFRYYGVLRNAAQAARINWVG